MAGKLIALIFAACLITPAMAAWPGRSGPRDAYVHRVGPYIGPGDILAHKVWYGVRAYSAATRGQKLMNVCDSDLVANTDNVCADIFSSPTTGDVVSKTVGSVTCPMPAGTTDDWNVVHGGGYQKACTIKTAYDLTGNGIDVSQAAPNKRPYLMLKALPILGMENRACMWYPDSIKIASSTSPGPAALPPGLMSSAVVNWGPAPLTMSAVLTNTEPGQWRVGNSSITGSIALRPSNANGTGTPDLHFAWSGANSGDTFIMNAGTAARLAPVLDHFPHAVQAMFSANGTTSSAYVDGVAFTGLSTGTTIAGSSTVELGATTTNTTYATPRVDYFNGVICEAGVAAGDQSAKNAAVNANQTAYFLTPTAIPKPVFDWTADFNAQTPGTRVDMPLEKQIFNDPSISAWANDNYTDTITHNYCSTPDVGTCQPAPIVEIKIVADGKNGTPGLELLLLQGSCGYSEPDAGNPHMTFSFPPSVVFNVLDVEYDIMFRDHTTSPAGVDFDFHSMGKPGVSGGWFSPAIQNGIGLAQEMWYGAGGSTATRGVNVGGDGVVLFASSTASGQHVQGVWYHQHMQSAFGQNGWGNMWTDDGPGTPVHMIVGYSRGDPWRLNNGGAWQGGLTTAQNPQTAYTAKNFAILPHFGGQGNRVPPYGDCAYNDSYIVYDNFHVRGYVR